MWRIGVDSGGTFTDICLVDEASGDVRVWKVPSTPDDPSRAIARGVVEGLAEAAGDSPAAVSYFGHGTTVGTNALIQHRGAPTGLITTEGFRDLLEIGRQRRPHLYDLQADKPLVLVPRARRHEVPERMRHDGRVEKPMDITNTSNLPVEALEAEYPLVVERYALVEDSGGPGKWRGGLGLWRQIRAEGHDCHAFAHGSRRLSAPWGLFGGLEGGRCRIVYSPGVPPPVKAQGFLGPGQSVAIITPGAGGYGNPRERDRALVRRDLAEGVISEHVAREVYGLADRPDTRAVARLGGT